MLSSNSINFYQYNELLEDELREEEKEEMIHFEPMFSYVDDERLLIKNLEENRLITKFKIVNQVNMKFIVYVKKDSLPMRLEKSSLKRNILEKMKKPFRSHNNINKEIKLMKLNGEASLVWSIDLWRTWNTLKAVYIQETNRFLVYEALLKNLDKLLQVGQTIAFASCYIDYNNMFKDTNNEKCYSFQRVEKNITLGH